MFNSEEAWPEGEWQPPPQPLLLSTHSGPQRHLPQCCGLRAGARNPAALEGPEGKAERRTPFYLMDGSGREDGQDEEKVSREGRKASEKGAPMLSTCLGL